MGHGLDGLERILCFIRVYQPNLWHPCSIFLTQFFDTDEFVFRR